MAALPSVSLAFNTLVLLQMFNVFNARSEDQSAFAKSVSKPLAVAFRGRIHRSADHRDLCPLYAAGFFDSSPEPCGLAAVRRSRQFRSVAAGVQQTGEPAQ